MKFLPLLFLFYLSFLSCKKEDNNIIIKDILIDSIFVDTKYVPNGSTVNGVEFNDLDIRIHFHEEVDRDQHIAGKIPFLEAGKIIKGLFYGTVQVFAPRLMLNQGWWPGPRPGSWSRRLWPCPDT